jgi:hypothetical protein
MRKELKMILECEPAPDAERRLAMAFAIILKNIWQKNTGKEKSP